MKMNSRNETLHVRATSADRPCPMIRRRVKIDRKTGRDSTMIYSDTPVEVPNVSFYRRAIVRGDLELVKKGTSK